MRETVSLSGVWRAQPDVFEEGLRLNYPSPAHHCGLWLEVDVPGVFDRILPALNGYEGTVWYRRQFDVPTEWKERCIRLEFDGVNYHTQVWLNGSAVGTNVDPFLWSSVRKQLKHPALKAH